MADPQNQGPRFVLWSLMAAGALAIMSASQAAGTAKGLVLPPVLHCASLTSHKSGLISSYRTEKQGTEVFELGAVPGALAAGEESIGYSGATYLAGSATQNFALMPFLPFFFLLKTYYNSHIWGPNALTSLCLGSSSS